MKKQSKKPTGERPPLDTLDELTAIWEGVDKLYKDLREAQVMIVGIRQDATRLILKYKALKESGNLKN